ncbi:mavicyanin [Musa acuminata AAA Group]|uniref:mavicyanin n=1 Tax=Musa acuminata AAA Group TaxID=214697 RepID=UPI0031E11387
MAIPRAIVAVAVMAAIAGLANATNFDVSWDLSTNYTRWVSDKTFRAGDTLTFSYTSSHDVVEVRSSSYATCNATSPVSKSATGNTLVALGAPGKRYFICGITGHCSRGMKIEIDVVTASSPPPGASPSPSVSPAAPTPPASSPPAPSTAPPSRTRTTAKVALGVVLMVLAL